MLENKSSQEKKKSQLSINVGGSGCVIGGVVLLGGGLAVAGLVAAFTIIKKRISASYDHQNEDAAADTLPDKIHDVTQGLGSVLQNPTTAVHQKSCYTNHSTPTVAVIESHMDSREFISARNMDLGDKSVAIMDGKKKDRQQEILFSDDFNKKSIEPCNQILNNEETSLQAPVTIIKNHSVENFQLINNTEMKKEDELAETQNLAIEDTLPTQSEEAEEEDYGGSEEHVMDKEEVSPEANSTMQPVEKEEQESEEDENLPMQPIDEEEGDDEDDHDEKHDNDDSSEEDVTEKEEESLEGTGSSSRESDVEAIWPTDMIEALSHELKVMNASNQNSVEKMAKIECDYLNSKSKNGSKNENAPTLNKKTPQEFVMSKVESIHLPMREVCVWLLLAIILLLLLLHIHRTSPLQDLYYENSNLAIAWRTSWANRVHCLISILWSLASCNP